jgi:hypothetical protein
MGVDGIERSRSPCLPSCILFRPVRCKKRWRLSPTDGVRPEVVVGSANVDRFLAAGSGRPAKLTRAGNTQKRGNNESCQPPMKGLNHPPVNRSKSNSPLNYGASQKQIPIS